MTSPFDETNAKASAEPTPPMMGSASRDSVHRAKARHALNLDEAEQWGSTLTAGHQMAFHWLRHDQSSAFGLVSCYVNGHPSALIVAANPDHAGKTVQIMPLFVALTTGMRVTAPDGDVIYDGVAASREAAA
jgi:hypothetical protein